jgi:hypothetical protein
MVFKLSNRAPERENLIDAKKVQRSEDVPKERKPKLATRLSSVFIQKRNDKHQVLKSDTYEEQTPPSSPAASAEPLSVTVVTSPLPAHTQQDLSAPVRRSSSRARSHKAKVESKVRKSTATTVRKPTATTTKTKTPVVTPSKSSAFEFDSSEGCSADAVARFLGMGEYACSNPLAPKPKKSKEAWHDWGKAPSDDDDEDGEENTPPSTPVTRTVLSDDENRQNGSQGQNTKNSTNTRTTEELGPDSRTPESEFEPDSPNRSHENFELILDPAVLKDAPTTSHKALAWMRNKSSIIQEERKEIDETVDTVNKTTSIQFAPQDDPVDTPAASANQDKPVQSSRKLLPFVKKLTNRKRTKSAKALTAVTAALMNEGELFGEEFVDDHEESVLSAPYSENNSTQAVMGVNAVSKMDEIPSQAEKKNNKAIENAPQKFGLRDDRSRSWGNLTKALASRRSEPTKKKGEPVNRTTSSPERLSSDKHSTLSAPVNLWKSVEDPNSGRLYYYHRFTRKTTWSKPDNFDALARQEKEQELCKSVRPETGKANEFKDQSTSAIPSDILINSEMSAVQQKRIDTGDEPTGAGGSQSILKKTHPRAEEITRLLAKMSPPNSDSVAKLMDQYEGREDELVVQLRGLVKNQPFDEPGAFASAEFPVDEGPSLAARTLSNPSLHSLNIRTQTAYTLTTVISARTDKTDRIANTAKRGNMFESIREGEEVYDDDSLSSNNESVPECHVNVSAKTQRALEAQKRNSGRTRSLKVEEFTSSRWGLQAEHYDGQVIAPSSPSQQKARKAPTGTTPKTSPPAGTPVWTNSSDTESNYNGDNDETDVDTFNDTVSALSAPDPEFAIRRDEFNRDRRKTLDDAIKRKDWDLAASVTDNIRNRSMDDHSEPESRHAEWTQSELDQFISDNDWDAVASYIAQMRDAKHKAFTPNGDARNETAVQSASIQMAAKTVSFDSNVQKRFGARSQLQSVNSEDEQSNSSWESESFYESDSDTSASSVLFTFDNILSPKRKEFSC